MRLKIMAIVLLLLIPLVTAKTDRMLTAQFDVSKSGQVNIIDIRVTLGSESLEITDEGDYSFEVLDSTGKVLSVSKFDVSFEAYVGPGDVLPDYTGTIGPIPKDVARVLLRMPYSDDADKFRIKQDGTVLYEAALTLCNEDNVCQSSVGENFLSCPSDCPSGSQDQLCDTVFDDVCDPDCKAQGQETLDSDCTCGNNACDGRENSFTCPADCGKPTSYLPYLIIALPVAFVVLVIGIIVIIIKKRGKKTKSSR